LDKLFYYVDIFYYINVESPNLDLKLGIGPKAGNFLSWKREGEGGGRVERETEIETYMGEIERQRGEIEGRDREIDGRNRKIER
jgi:hypothetical protein